MVHGALSDENEQANFQHTKSVKGGVYTSPHKSGFVKGAQAIGHQLLDEYSQPQLQLSTKRVLDVSE